MSYVCENWDGISVRLPMKRARNRDWKRAFRAFDRLMEDGEDTQQAFEIVEALSGPSLRKSFRKFLQTSEGRQTFEQRIELAQEFDDMNWLRDMPEGSFGRAYYDFVTAEGLSAAGLVAESLKVADSSISETDNDFAWYSRRIRDLHDLWHVLTGYGRDGLGELSLLAFTYSQTKSLGALFIAYLGGRASRKELNEKAVMDVIWQAKKDGRRAAFLPAANYLELFPRPLNEVRQELGIPDPCQYRDFLPTYQSKVAMAHAA